MADVRLIALLLVACADADAQPPAPKLTPPPSWKPQPGMAAAAKAALDKTPVDSIEAFGEPAMGCYSLLMTGRASGKATEMAEQLVRGLTDDKKQKRKLEIKDLVKPTADEGVVSLRFETPPYQGRLRARLGQGKLVALACWSSQREPAACEQVCTTILGAVP